MSNSSDRRTSDDLTDARTTNRQRYHPKPQRVTRIVPLPLPLLSTIPCSLAVGVASENGSDDGADG